MHLVLQLVKQRECQNEDGLHFAFVAVGINHCLQYELREQNVPRCCYNKIPFATEIAFEQSEYTHWALAAMYVDELGG